MLLTESTSETYGPWVYSPSYKFTIYFILQSFLSNLHHKEYQKYLLSLLDLTFASGREGIDNPLPRWLQGSYLFV